MHIMSMGIIIIINRKCGQMKSIWICEKRQSNRITHTHPVYLNSFALFLSDVIDNNNGFFSILRKVYHCQLPLLILVSLRKLEIRCIYVCFFFLSKFVAVVSTGHDTTLFHNVFKTNYFVISMGYWRAHDRICFFFLGYDRTSLRFP